MKVRVVTRCVEHECGKQRLYGTIGKGEDGELWWEMSQPSRPPFLATFCPLCGEALPQTLGEAEVDGEG